MKPIKILFGLFVLGFGLSLPAHAQSYPNKPIRIIYPFSGGTGGDASLRIIAQKLSDSLKQPVVVEPRPGANGIIGSDIVAKSAPDGYTLIVTTVNTQTITPHLYTRLPYDPTKDFAPITTLFITPYMLVASNRLPANSVREFVSLAKASPGKYSIGYVSSTPQLGAELFKVSAGINLLMVPYKTSVAAYTDLNNGELDTMMEALTAGRMQVSSGRMKALAITSLRRSALMPETPTVAESGYPGFELGTLLAAFAPAGTPKKLIDTLNSEIIRIIRIPEIEKQIQQFGFDIITSTPEQLGDIVKTDFVKWGQVVKDANIPKAD